MGLKKILYLILLIATATACDDDTQSNIKEIRAFSVNAIEATIDQTNKTVRLTLPKGSDLKKIKPTIKVSPKSSVSPNSDMELDFTNPVKYTVTAEDGSQQEYLVTITTAKSSDKYILVFKIGQNSGDIDWQKNTVDAEVPVDTDWTKITPTITVSEGATIYPASGTDVDFTNPVKYTVTAEDGSKVEYVVKIYDAISRATPVAVTTMIETVDKESTRYYFSYNWAREIQEYATGHSAPRHITKFIYDKGKVSEILITEENEPEVISVISDLNVTYPDNKTVNLTDKATNAVSKIKLNDWGKVTEYTKSNGDTEKFEYDKQGNIIKYTHANGDFETMTFENRNGAFKDSFKQQWLSLFTVSPAKANPQQITSVTTYTKDGQLKETINYKNQYNITYNLYHYSYTSEGIKTSVSFFYE